MVAVVILTPQRGEQDYRGGGEAAEGGDPQVRAAPQHGRHPRADHGALPHHQPGGAALGPTASTRPRQEPRA